jgi:hypothetical protein
MLHNLDVVNTNQCNQPVNSEMPSMIRLDPVANSRATNRLDRCHSILKWEPMDESVNDQYDVHN